MTKVKFLDELDLWAIVHKQEYCEGVFTCNFIFYFFLFWSDVWPSMVTHTWNLCPAFNPSKCTHTVVNTHIVNTHRAVGSQCCDARGAVGGSVPGSRVPQSWYWRWRECSLVTRDSNPQPRVTSPMLYPWALRPRLPHSWVKGEVNFQNKNVLIIYSTPTVANGLEVQITV